MIRKVGPGIEWAHSAAGKYILTDGPMPWSIVGGARYVVRASDSGARLYVQMPHPDTGAIDFGEREMWIAARRVIVLCDTWDDVKRCFALNTEARVLYDETQRVHAKNMRAMRAKLEELAAPACGPGVRLRKEGGEP